MYKRQARATAEKAGKTNKAALDDLREVALIKARADIASADKARADTKAEADALAVEAEKTKPDSEKPGFDSISEGIRCEIQQAQAYWLYYVAGCKGNALLAYRQHGTPYTAAAVELAARESFTAEAVKGFGAESASMIRRVDFSKVSSL